jgi:hypothetical protein
VKIRRNAITAVTAWAGNTSMFGGKKMSENNTNQTTYKEVKVGKTLYRVTSIFKGEIDLAKALEDLAVATALTQLQTSDDIKKFEILKNRLAILGDMWYN